MQDELEADYPDLDIQLIGINEFGQETGNPSMTEGRDLPWLQDVDANEDGLSDVWHDSWDVVFRDVVILNGNNERVGTYNLTVNDLADAEDFETLRQMFVDAASMDQAPPPPASVDLLPAFDSGLDDTDNRTNYNNVDAAAALQVRVTGVTNGATVRLFADGVQIGQATATADEVDITTDGTTRLADGKRRLTATQEVDGFVSGASPTLYVYVDTAIGHFAPTEATINGLYTYDVQNTDEGESGFSYSLSEAPAGATIDANTGLVSWIPTPDQFGHQFFIAVATDRVGNTRTEYVDVIVRGMAPDFALPDVNPATPTFAQPVSPRDYLQQVSGWYFTYAT